GQGEQVEYEEPGPEAGLFLKVRNKLGKGEGPRQHEEQAHACAAQNGDHLLLGRPALDPGSPEQRQGGRHQAEQKGRGTVHGSGIAPEPAGRNSQHHPEGDGAADEIEDPFAHCRPCFGWEEPSSSNRLSNTSRWIMPPTSPRTTPATV